MSIKRQLCSLAFVLVWGTTTLAQLTDIQPGRNFPTATDAFGGGRSENIDVGDIDNDGDLDVGVANGGDGPVQANRLFLNDGGIQGGSEGTFTDGTALRFAGVPDDTSRDIEFADLDGDFDLDVFIANRGNSINGGEVSRAYRNLGGSQAGSIGFFTEDTDTFWGNLVSVPLTKEFGIQDGQGPWKDFACDCEFGDLDDDGDLDLFHSSYGLNINGSEDSRIFLNDGTGTFDELSPWANVGSDIKLHTFDIDLADFDGDEDLDIFASSRSSQARVYRNNFSQSLGTWPGAPFLDITQTALIDTNATFSGGSNYEAEFADLDGDGDFDVWALNYDGFTDRYLRNNGDFSFHKAVDLLEGDPNIDENEVDFLDYDSDGDLDAFLANFSGTNPIYQGGLAQGLLTYSRTGTLAAPGPETPTGGNGGTTLDADCADLDGDGDPDILLANDSNRQNKVWFNELGVPDTHAPTYAGWTDQADKSDGSDTIIHARLLDNAGYYVIDMYDVDLLYRIDAGLEVCVKMTAMRGQLFRGVIPGGLSGTLAYRIEATDDAGNTGATSTRSYIQTSSSAILWENLGCGTPGLDGKVPYLQITGTQLDTELVTIQLTDARANRVALLWVALAPTAFSAAGGTIFAHPADVSLVFNTGNAGGLHIAAPWLAGPVGTGHWWQVIVSDPASIHGITLSNGVHGVQP